MEFEIKEIYGREAVDYLKFSCPAFHKTMPWLADADIDEKQRLSDENRLNNPIGGVRYYRYGAFADGKLAANIEIAPTVAMFDGNEIPMNIVGDVCTDVTFRRHGAIRQIFTKCFETMYENGQIISTLDPFKYNYYRQFGYEAAGETHIWEIPTDYLPKSTDGIEQYVGTDTQKAEIKQIRSEWNRKNNLGLCYRDARWEQWFTDHAPFKTGYFGFIHRTNGTADGFFCYTNVYEGNTPMVLDATGGAFWYSNRKAQKALLAFAGTLSDYSRGLRIKLPESENIVPEIEVTGGWGRKLLERQIKLNGMGRVIDAERVLAVCKKHGRGKASIGITDTYAPWNNDCFTVEYDGSNTLVTRGGKPDIVLPIGAFSAMILGRGGLDAVDFYGDTRILGNEVGLEGIFFAKTVFSQDNL